MNTQTSVMTKIANKADQNEADACLSWVWRPEVVHDTILRGRGQVAANQILDQKTVANDASDYLWYMTR